MKKWLRTKLEWLKTFMKKWFWQKPSFFISKIWQSSPRALQLFIANFIGLPLIFLLLFCLQKFFNPSDDVLKGAGIWNFIVVVLAIPSAFMVWYFRDQNSKESIENQRKDINLKDFQKLSELAAGMYLVEDKVTKEEKEDEKTVTKTESSQRAEKSISRREASEALQIAAVYQLKAFLDGEHGKYFKGSTFHLLLSIWRGITQPYLNDVNKLKKVTSTPLAKAIESVLTIDKGKIFHEHKDDLVGISLAGMYLTNIDFKDLDFTSCKFIGTVFRKVNFHNAIFTYTDFSHANFDNVKIYNPKFIATCFFRDVQNIYDPEIYIHENGVIDINATLELRKSLHSLGLYSQLEYISEDLPQHIEL